MLALLLIIIIICSSSNPFLQWGAKTLLQPLSLPLPLALLLTWEMNERWWGEREREQRRLCRHSRHAAECNQLENYLRIWATARYSNLKIKVKQTKRREKNIQKRIERNQRRRRRRSTLTLTSLHVWQNVSHNVDCVQQLLLLLLLVLLLLLLLLCTHSSTLWLGWPGDFKAIPSWERERVLVSVCLCQCMCVLLTSDPSN